jgi:hypothetical protein
MFILDSDQIPGTAAQLTRAISTSLRRSIELPASASPVVLTGELPNLDSLAVDVSNGQIDTNQPLPDTTPPGKTDAGPTAKSFTIEGQPISIEGIPLQLDLSAKNVTFAYARNPAGKLIATLRDASDGHLSVQLEHEHLEQAILTIARKVSASTGVAIQKVSAKLTSIDPTTVDVLLNITAKKFVTAVVKISGRLSINDRMVATASNLNANSDGMVGGIAVNFIRPHLQQLNGRPLPLLAFSLGNVKLRGVNVTTTDGVRIVAQFGSETA